MMLRSTATLLAIGIAGCAAATEPPLPFEGKWDCGVAVFTFTATTYFNGTDTLPILSIDSEDNARILTFADDYQIAVTRNADGTLDWLSMASGDMFTCTAVN